MKKTVLILEDDVDLAEGKENIRRKKMKLF